MDPSFSPGPDIPADLNVFDSCALYSRMRLKPVY